MSKRAAGEGSIRRKDNGIWECRLTIGYSDDGKQKRKSFYGKTKKEVIEKLNKYQQDLQDGLRLDEEYLFKDWAEIWFESHKANIEPVTQTHYRYTLRHLNRFFGDRKINTIRAYDVEDMLHKLREEGFSRSTLAQSRGMLFQIMNKAEANDLIRKNPVRFAEKTRYRGPENRKDAFKTEEVELMMEQLPITKIGLSIRLMLATGMRTQELLALEPKHIEEDGSVIHIEQAVTMERGTAVVGMPKSRDSYRDVLVPKSIRRYALLLRDTTDRFIWQGQNIDRPCSPSHFRTLYKKALAEIGMRYLPPHSCRHTYVSQMQALGVGIETIQSFVGHADTDMTVHYLHVQDSIRQDAINRFDRAFGSKIPLHAVTSIA